VGCIRRGLGLLVAAVVFGICLAIVLCLWRAFHPTPAD
jgi:hypothetical protein